MNEKERENSKRRAILFVIVFMTISLSLVVFIMARSSSENPTTDRIARTAVIPTHSQSELPSEKQNAIVCFDSLNFISGQKEQTVYFVNPPQNDCVMDFSIVLKTNNEQSELWHTKGIKAGTEITDITLNRILNKGIYDAEFICSCYDVNNHSQLNGASIHFTLIVS